MSQETRIAMRYLVGKLAADPTVDDAVGDRIYDSVAPAGTAYPYVVISLLSGVDTPNPIGAPRTGTVCRHLVEVVNNATSFTGMEPTVDAIEAVLHNTRGSVDGGLVRSCKRVRPFQLVQPVGGLQIRRLGAEYRVEVQAT